MSDVRNLNTNVNQEDVLCKVIREDDNYYVVDCATGEKSEPLTISKDGIAFKLPENAANRTWLNVKNAVATIDTDGYVGLTYKATKTIGSVTHRLPNEKLIAYLSPEEQEEYKAIIARAIAARDAAKAQPKTELEKAKEKADKAQAAYEKLLAMAELTGETDETDAE